jgi:hypothetical protein
MFHFDGKGSRPIDDRADDICDTCLDVPWESFGTLDDPASFTEREVFMSWKYIVPDGTIWPGSSSCRICRFLRNLLADHGFDITIPVKKLRGGWDD